MNSPTSDAPEEARLYGSLRRLRTMFRMNIGLVVFGVLLVALGIAYIFTDSSGLVLSLAMLFLVAAIFNGYKIVLSTMKLIERAREKGIHLR